MQREYRHLFPPLQALIITQTNHPPGDFFFCQKRQIQRLLLVFLETIVVFGDSKARITLQLGLLCSTSSGCCREPLSRPKALTGGQSLSSLAQQSEQRGDTHPSASSRACAWPPPFPPWLTERGVIVNVHSLSHKNKSLHVN